MSPRRNRREPPRQPVRRTPVGETVEHWSDGEWVVRTQPAAGHWRSYRCPGCDQEIPAGVPHLVAWPADQGATERRHWHRSCWRARERRAPRQRRRG